MLYDELIKATGYSSEQINSSIKNLQQGFKDLLERLRQAIKPLIKSTEKARAKVKEHKTWVKLVASRRAYPCRTYIEPIWDRRLKINLIRSNC